MENKQTTQGSHRKDITQLKLISRRIRQELFQIIYDQECGHYSSSLSCVEILVALYFGGVMHFDISDPQTPFRDRFILSKGHSAAAHYCTLCEAGFFSKKTLHEYCTIDSKLGGLEKEFLPYGMEFSGGSLGHGLGFAAGIALISKTSKQFYHTFVLLGDGECQEGSIWEAAICIAHHKLGNVTAILDCNQLQASGKVEDILSLENLSDKWKAFGWKPIEVDGHDISQLIQALKLSTKDPTTPYVIIAKTTKGKGISFMEGSSKWHYKIMDKTQALIARRELNV